MKKLLAIFAVVLLFQISVAEASVDEEYQRFWDFSSSVTAVAGKIAAQQKHILQDTEEMNYEESYVGKVGVRLWKGDKYTFAFNYNEEWKGAFLTYFATTDPSFTFAGGIKIGTPVKVLREYFLNDGEGDDTYYAALDVEFITFQLDKNKKVKAIILVSALLPEKIKKIL